MLWLFTRYIPDDIDILMTRHPKIDDIAEAEAKQLSDELKEVGLDHEIRSWRFKADDPDWVEVTVKLDQPAPAIQKAYDDFGIGGFFELIDYGPGTTVESAPVLELVTFGADGFSVARKPVPGTGVSWTPDSLALYALGVASAAGATLIASRVVNWDRDPHADITASMRCALDSLTPVAPASGGDSR